MSKKPERANEPFGRMSIPRELLRFASWKGRSSMSLNVIQGEQTLPFSQEERRRAVNIKTLSPLL